MTLVPEAAFPNRAGVETMSRRALRNVPLVTLLGAAAVMPRRSGQADAMPGTANGDREHTVDVRGSAFALPQNEIRPAYRR